MGVHPVRLGHQHPEAYVFAHWQWVCATRGTVAPIPEPSHKCTDMCRFYTVTPCLATEQRRYLVCMNYSNIHLCGDDCTSAVKSQNAEGYVCTLTGFCVRGAIISTDAPFVKDDTKPVQLGIIRMHRKAKKANIGLDDATTPRKRRRRPDGAAHTNTVRVRAKIHSRIMEIFSSKGTRLDIYNIQRRRLADYTKVIVR